MTIKSILTKTLGTAIGIPMLAGALLLAPQAAQARVFISVGIAPPAIPVYAQPLCPGDGYIWTPGYWAYTDDGYQWVEGAWVLAPYTGALWTPGYWGYDNGLYGWNAGYWGTSIGYYGGINYGFGYFGTGFYGGYWNHGAFFYNRAYGHFGGGFRNDHLYNQRVGNFNGRPGGTSFVRGGFDGNRVGTFNNAGRNATSRGGFGQNTGRSNMTSAAPYQGGFNRGAQRGSSVEANRGGYTQSAPARQANNSQSNARRPSGNTNFRAPSGGAHPSASSGSHSSSNHGGGGSHGGHR
jgi:hypothetical protein